MNRLLFILPVVALAACSGKDPNTGNGEHGQIDVTYENYNQAETARNFNNWVKLGSDNEIVHREELSPTGSDAPTIRMNLDTLYSIGVYDNGGDMSLTIPDSGLYQGNRMSKSYAARICADDFVPTLKNSELKRSRTPRRGENACQQIVASEFKARFQSAIFTC